LQRVAKGFGKVSISFLKDVVGISSIFKRIPIDLARCTLISKEFGMEYN